MGEVVVLRARVPKILFREQQSSAHVCVYAQRRSLTPRHHRPPPLPLAHLLLPGARCRARRPPKGLAAARWAHPARAGPQDKDEGASVGVTGRGERRWHACRCGFAFHPAHRRRHRHRRARARRTRPVWPRERGAVHAPRPGGPALRAAARAGASVATSQPDRPRRQRRVADQLRQL